MQNELFLLITMVALRAADDVASYLPAQGYVPGLGEGNPFAIAAIDKLGYVWGFVLMSLVTMSFVAAFYIGTHLEEARRAGMADRSGILRVRKFRIVGLACLTALSSLPLINNLAIAITLI
jgi:hypothetical protein